MTVREIAKECNCSMAWVYSLRKKLGRLPTIEEINKRKGKVGRPIKYAEQEIQTKNEKDLYGDNLK